MDFSKIRLVAADMDGTLLNSKHELDKDFFPLFNKLRSLGILFVAASGRQYFNLHNLFREIKDDVIFLAENGSYVVSKGEELMVQSMAKDVVRDKLLLARSIPETFSILCGKKSAYIDNETPAFVDKLTMYYDKVTIVDDLLKVNDDEFLKIAICDFAGAERNSYPIFRETDGNVQVKVSGALWVDISHREANKGKALNDLQKRFDISAAETMAFGDYLNDLEMIQQADLSYAMSNAHPDVKQAARFVIGTNDEGSVLEVLRKLVQGR